LEIAKLEGNADLQIAYLGSEQVERAVVQEISGFELAFPFVAFCKGGNKLIVSNMHYSAQPVEFHLKLQERFICWVKIDEPD